MVVVLEAFAAATLLVVAPATMCEGLSALDLRDADVMVAESVPAREGLPAFCRVTLEATPSADSNINIEIWMPAQGWNGRLLGVGSGGYAGAIERGGLATGLASGYTVVTSDMGTSPASGSTGAPHLIGHPERWSDFGWRSTHLMTVLAKRVVAEYYGKSPDYAYFSGCSTGGMQGLREAQQFPDDYDGILAGSPGSNRARIHVAILSNYAEAQRHPDSALSVTQLERVHDAVVQACSGPDESYVVDPPSCAWKPDALSCDVTSIEGCLNAHQLETVEALYRGPVNPRTGESIFPGLSRGSELGWRAYMPPAVARGEMPWLGVFQWVFGADWDWREFDYDQDVTTLETVLGPFFVATDPDLSRFRDRGGKLLLYNGWADWLSATTDTTDYYSAVVNDIRLEESSDDVAALRATRDFARLFLFPGMSHCSGGEGPDRFDGLTALTEWVERGKAPRYLIATKISEGEETERATICAFPELPQENGRCEAGPR